MYVPKEFGVSDLDAACRLIERHSFGILVSCEADQPVGTHLPFMLDRSRGPNGTLVGHMARANNHWQGLDGRQAMVLFQGPHGYISPSWYADEPAVPTWNYAAVHVYGQVEITTDADRLRTMVFDLAHLHEIGPDAWQPENLPERYLQGMLGAIVGLELTIERLEAKHKLSQNRPLHDQLRVIDALNASDRAGDQALGTYMAAFAPTEIAEPEGDDN
jgi:transcriptional regulator